MTRLIVIGGLPGTGKTTLARGIVRELSAVYLRVDVVETPLIRAGVEVGPLGYEVVRELAASNLELGGQVVVDLVNPLHVTRAMWRELAAALDVPLVVFECVLPDRAEHRRRVEGRVPDLKGQVTPTWAEVLDREYEPWDDSIDGPRVRIDMTDAASATEAAIRALAEVPSGQQVAPDSA